MSIEIARLQPILPGVLEVIATVGNLKTALTPDQDFYDAGITSVMALPILLELEDRYQITIPDELFIAARSPLAVAEIIAGLRPQ
ncbi:MAG: acyl carrier protein [Acidobacteriota bacterium]|nr:acyl carrier protein [Acidobacteriota bacterium]